MKIMHTLLIISILLLSTSTKQGYGRELRVPVDTDAVNMYRRVKAEGIGKMRELIEVMDYGEPGPNTNPRNRYQIPPPPLPF